MDSKQEWLNQCAERFRDYGCDQKDADYLALCCLENVDGDLTYDPVDCADEEVTYWGD